MALMHRLELQGWLIGLVHEIRPRTRPTQEILDQHFGGQHVDVLVSGDTHLESLEEREDVLLVNPGSATLPHHKEFRLGTIGLLDITRDTLTAEILLLGETPGSPNPGTAQKVVLTRDAG